MRIFLDDERAAPAGWIGVRWPHEAIALLETGAVEEISLDHDLGDDARGTGYDVILWIERAVALEAFEPPRIQVHSANSSARLKMQAGIAAIARLSEAQRGRPPSVGTKFAADGSALPFAGSTIISPLSPASGAELQSGLVEIYAARDDHEFSSKVAYLPPSSYHVTVFGCAMDTTRERGRWPSGLSYEASIDACHRAIEDRLRLLPADWEMPLRFRIDTHENPADRLPLSFGLVPADGAEQRKLRALRDTLSRHLGIRAAGHASYRFHVTLGYSIDWLTANELAIFLSRHAAWRAMLAQRSPLLELTSLEFCTYRDMLAFERRLILA